MRRYLGWSALLTGIASLVLGGCICGTDIEDCKAMNRKLDELRKEAEAKANALDAENLGLRADLQQRDAALATADQKNQMLTARQQQMASQLLGLQQEVDRLRNAGPTQVNVNVLPALPAQIDEKLKAFAAANPDLVEYLPEYGMVKLKSDLTFEKGSDFVNPGAKAALAKFAEIIRSPDAAGFNVYVAGHTDDIPIKQRETLIRHPNNWYLSVHRAVAVQEVVQAAGVPGQRIGAMGFGEFHPVAPNAPGNKGNPINRRVEIWIVPQSRLLTAPTTTAMPLEK